jgi:hypothetical protein
MKTSVRTFFCLAVVLLVATTTIAQDFAVDSFTLDSGGGTSSGGVFEMSGTISAFQPDAMTGGVFSVEGAFESLVSVVPPLPPEPITIFDNTTGSDNGGSGVTATAWLASRFCLGPQSYHLASVSLLLNSQDFSGGAGPPSTVRLQIHANEPVSGKPSTNTGLIMTLSSHTNPVALVRGQQLVRWTNATPFKLAADTCYWAVLSRESGGRIGQIASFTKPTGDAGSFGASSSANAGATWGAPTLASNHKMLITGVPTKGASAPLLFMMGQGADVRIYWPHPAMGFVLDQSPTLTGAWSQVPFPYSTNEIDISVSVAPSAENRFYRLRRP